jgi:hypothetical protein
MSPGAAVAGLLTSELEVSHICVTHALDQILLKATCRGHKDIHHAMLYKVPAGNNRDRAAHVVEQQLGKSY